MSRCAGPALRVGVGSGAAWVKGVELLAGAWWEICCASDAQGAYMSSRHLAYSRHRQHAVTYPA